MSLNYRLRSALEDLLETNTHLINIQNDPVRFPKRYSDRGDVEISAFLSACFSYGNVHSIITTLEKLFKPMGASPMDYVMSASKSRLKNDYKSFKHRIHISDDLILLILFLRHIMKEHNSLERYWCFGIDKPNADEPAITYVNGFISNSLSMLYKGIFHNEPRGLYFTHFFPIIGVSCCKKLFLFLRWMIRHDKELDLGLWGFLSPAQLIIPLDVHVARISRFIGLTNRRTTNLKTSLDITHKLREFSPLDPLKYDFPISHQGISEGCRGRFYAPVCASCPLRQVCIMVT